MINRLINQRVARQQLRNREIDPVRMDRSKSILFSIFSRYGDGIIALKVINEFIARYPGKTYWLVTSHQLRPYAEALLDRLVSIISVRKRNPFELLRAVWALKKADIDLAFNPWGSRGDSEFFLTFAKAFYTFNSLRFHHTVNLYFRARRYLGLPTPAKGNQGFALPQPVRRILVCPSSTDVRKSLRSVEVKALITWLKSKFPEARPILCFSPGEMEKSREIREVDCFTFAKSEARSRQFLHLMAESDLFVGVDAGPLHLADALGKPGIGLFGPTAPEAVLDTDSHILPLRVANLKGIFCAVQSCREPLCLLALLQDDPERHLYSPAPHLKEERTVCRFFPEASKVFLSDGSAGQEGGRPS